MDKLLNYKILIIGNSSRTVLALNKLVQPFGSFCL